MTSRYTSRPLGVPNGRFATTRYVKSDDVHVAYQVIGDGPVDVLWVPGFVSNMEAGWQNPHMAALLRRLASFCRLILFDKRGTAARLDRLTGVSRQA
jgi:hypothetical protein